MTLDAFLQSQGVTLPAEFTVWPARPNLIPVDISSDGKTIVGIALGTSTHGAFRIRLDGATP